MNALAGPERLQVFDADRWPEVRANLTAGSFASLRDVRVRANAYLGVQEDYVLDALLVFGLEPSPRFLASFSDPKVAAAVPDDYPNGMPLSMSVFSANLLCAQATWLAEARATELRAALLPGPPLL